MYSHASTQEMRQASEHSSIVHSVAINYLHDLAEHSRAQRGVLDAAIADVDELIRRTDDSTMLAAFESTRMMLQHLARFSADDMPGHDTEYWGHPVYQAVYRLREIMLTCSRVGPQIAHGWEVGINPCRRDQHAIHGCVTTLQTSLTVGELSEGAVHLRAALQEHVHQCAQCPHRVVEAQTVGRDIDGPKHRDPWLTRLLRRFG